MALAWAIIGVLAGIALGLRFKVLVLVPAIALALLIVGLFRGESFGSTVLAMLTVGMAIQLGYLIGIFLAKRIQ